MGERADDGARTALEAFTAERPRLVGLAYRMLASRADAEDVVQDAWLRWQGADHATVERPAAWLTTTVSRLALDRLRARQRDRADYVGPWLPEPVVITDDDPAVTIERRDSLRYGFLHLLERLSPRERVALVLADVFEESHQSISGVLDESVVNCRQLVSRARRKLSEPPAFATTSTRDAAANAAATMRPRTGRPTSAAEIDALLDRFMLAAVGGDRDALLTVLAPDVVLVSDGGANQHAARRPIQGAAHVVQVMMSTARRLAAGALIERLVVNAEPMLIIRVGGQVVLAMAVDGVGGLIDTVLVVVNPAKLARIDDAVAIS